MKPLAALLAPLALLALLAGCAKPSPPPPPADDSWDLFMNRCHDRAYDKAVRYERDNPRQRLTVHLLGDPSDHSVTAEVITGYGDTFHAPITYKIRFRRIGTGWAPAKISRTENGVTSDLTSLAGETHLSGVFTD